MYLATRGKHLPVCVYVLHNIFVTTEAEYYRVLKLGDNADALFVVESNKWNRMNVTSSIRCVLLLLCSAQVLFIYFPSNVLSQTDVS